MIVMIVLVAIILYLIYSLEYKVSVENERFKTTQYRLTREKENLYEKVYYIQKPKKVHRRSMKGYRIVKYKAP